MPELQPAALALGAIIVVAIMGWVASLIKRDVGIVDSLWGLFFLIAAIVYAIAADSGGARAALLLALVAVWSLRLSGHIAWRNRGEPEDRRYRAIRSRNAPGFPLKSLYLVFGFQGILAWIIAMPLFAALSGDRPISVVDAAGVALWITGFLFEAVGDWQLSRFKVDPANAGRVMDRGLWRYTRHPNYFGEACLWWGYYLIALAAGGGWTVFAPLLMTFLLLRVSGVTLLEKDIGARRPGYGDYIARTNAFFPGRPRPQAGGAQS